VKAKYPAPTVSPPNNLGIDPIGKITPIQCKKLPPNDTAILAKLINKKKAFQYHCLALHSLFRRKDCNG
jgi:hypothetical protein